MPGLKPVQQSEGSHTYIGCFNRHASPRYGSARLRAGFTV
jgi:hypothetical protein